MIKSALIIGVLCCATTVYASLRIFGGRDALDGEYPYQVSIMETVSETHVCGGAIIDKKWILTAAHCLHDIESKEDIIILVGTNSLEGNSSTKSYHTVKDFFFHKGFRANTGVKDIGLIQINESIQFNGKVKPVRLPTKVFKHSDPKKAVATGWGLKEPFSSITPDILQGINLTLIDNKKCEVAIATAMLFLDVGDANICTLTKKGEGTCLGDSGSPLVANNQIIGIVSFGDPCAHGVPDVFTRVSSYISWIKGTISNHTDPIKNRDT